MADSLVRLRLRVSPAIAAAAVQAGSPDLTPQKRVEATVASLLVSAGALSDALLVTEDPTDEGAFSVLGAPGPAPDAEPSGVSVLAREGVEAPPPPARATAPHLDPDLMQDEARAVALALIKDVDPDRLEGMGDAFASDLPCVGALLLSKARLEHARRRGGQDARDAEKRRRSLVTGQGGKPTGGRRGLGGRGGGAPLALSSDRTEQVLADLRRATADLGPGAVGSWETLAGGIALALEEDPGCTAPPTSLSDAQIRDADPEEVRVAIGAILGDPHGASLPPEAIADLTRVSFSSALVAKDAVRRPGGGVLLVDPDRWRRVRALLPDRPPSNAAAQLAASTVRPSSQGTADPTAIGPMFSIAKRNRTSGTQLDRGKRAVARRLWVEWWRGAERAGILGAVR